MKVPITKPCLGEEERRAVASVLESGWLVQGPKVAEFEQSFAAFTGAPFAVATTSCTTALHLALVAAGVGPGDEVIVPSFTWVATANVVEMQSAKPVFVDIDLATFNIDPSQIERAIGPRTKALMPVSLFGLSAQMEPIIEIAARRGITVIEDAACAFGASYQGRHAGTLADVGCFSFHPRKAITTGEGGMILTSNSELAQSAKSLRDHGASKSDLERHTGAASYLLPDFDVVGYNYRMTDMQGALGTVQMTRANWLLAERRRVAARYNDDLAEMDALQAPRVPQGFGHSYQSYVCLFGADSPTLDALDERHAQRNAFMAALESVGVATRPGTHAVHALGYYSRKYGLKREDYPNALMADKLSVALPLYAQMTDDEQGYVVEQVSKLLAHS